MYNEIVLKLAEIAGYLSASEDAKLRLYGSLLFCTLGIFLSGTEEHLLELSKAVLMVSTKIAEDSVKGYTIQ